MYQGSKSWSLGSSSTSNEITLYTVDDIKKLMELSSFDKAKFCCQIINGDYSANPFVVTDAAIKNDTLQVKLDIAVKGSVRFNFVFFYGAYSL